MEHSHLIYRYLKSHHAYQEFLPTLIKQTLLEENLEDEEEILMGSEFSKQFFSEKEIYNKPKSLKKKKKKKIKIDKIFEFE